MIALDLVIVTYNRLEKLKKTLKHYESQTKGFRNLIIVNNCSTDGTDDFLNEWYEEFKEFERFKPIIINAKENLGGSGGFYLGQKKAMELKADWVFVADDDAYANPTMVDEFYEFVELNKNKRIAAVCAAVLNIDGSICLNHRNTHAIINGEYKRFSSKIEDYNKDYFPIDELSYVGSFINFNALKKVGLVNPNYFIYYDDSEHSFRLKKYGEIVVVPSIRIFHDCGDGSSPKYNGVTWRWFYMNRNSTHMLLKHWPRVGLRIVFKQLKDDLHLLRIGCEQPDWYIVKKTAIWDAFFRRLGKHKLYRP